MITPAEFEQEMKELRDLSKKKENDGCLDELHLDADNLMCETLVALGYDAGVKYFKEMNKWYA